jgi:hypothetical protein
MQKNPVRLPGLVYVFQNQKVVLGLLTFQYIMMLYS